MSDPLLDRKIEDIASGLVSRDSNVLGKLSMSNKENAYHNIIYQRNENGSKFI
jgi:hypothetical protein